MPLCCPIADRPDVRQIDAALARGEAYRKVRVQADARSTELGVPPVGSDWAIRRHRQHVLARISGTDIAAGEAPCCVIADRPDADAIDTDLRAGLSYRKVHAAAKARHPELSVNETTVWRHRRHLGLPFPHVEHRLRSCAAPATLTCNIGPAHVQQPSARMQHEPAHVQHPPTQVEQCRAHVEHVPRSLEAPDPRTPPLLDFTDPTAVARWLHSVRVALDDAESVTADMLKPEPERDLGARLHRVRLDEARRVLRQLLDHADPPPTPEPRSLAESCRSASAS